MVRYDFWFAIKGEEVRCTVERAGDFRDCMKAAARVWEALDPVGIAITRHPTTGETPEEFRARMNRSGGRT